MGARTRQYNIAASWVILYCLTPGPHVSPHHLFPFEQERAAAHTHSLSLSYSHCLFFLNLFILCCPFFLSCSILFLVFLFRTRMKYEKLKRKKFKAAAGIETRTFL
jgi:hypothetical protein